MLDHGPQAGVKAASADERDDFLVSARSLPVRRSFRLPRSLFKSKSSWQLVQTVGTSTSRDCPSL
jgi:hypothetical protein